MKIAVYTAIFNATNPIDKPGTFQKLPGVDYFLFTNLDPKIFNNTSWTVKQVPIPLEHIPKQDDKRKYIYCNRYYKWHPHIVLAEYDIIMYIDGFQIPDASKHEAWYRMFTMLYQNPSIYLVANPHPTCKCAYREAEMVVICKKDDPLRMDILTDYFSSLQFPKDYGLFWNGCFIFKNTPKKTNPIAAVYASLWDDMVKFTYRDQPLFMVNIWKNNARGFIAIADLETMVRNVDSNHNHVYIN